MFSNKAFLCFVLVFVATCSASEHLTCSKARRLVDTMRFLLTKDRCNRQSKLVCIFFFFILHIHYFGTCVCIIIWKNGLDFHKFLQYQMICLCDKVRFLYLNIFNDQVNKVKTTELIYFK